MPALLLAVAASEGINIFRNTPSILAMLQENIHAARAFLDRVDCITIPSYPASPNVHIYIKKHKIIITSLPSGNDCPCNKIFKPDVNSPKYAASLT
jgi:serine palmitoyltransferase